MRQFIFYISSIILFTSNVSFAAPGVEIDVQLSPAGSFKAKTNKIKGVAKQKGNQVAASKVLVDLSSLETGISLRDKHLKQRLLTDKHPVAKLINAKGKDGKGEATFSLMGKEQKVTGTYKTKGNELISEFKMSLPELGITDVKYMGIGVKDEVTVRITVPVEQIPASAERTVSSQK